MIDYFTEEVIKIVLGKHPSECVFELDAPKNIAERLSRKTMDEWLMKQNRDKFKTCWHASEIYCPHEGINRLAECGVKSLDWELV
jgi:hypothetical protein